ncbi:LRP6 [Branchiostoma lanceolatum]|uniref:LRP6 protein n=1 Tax=Branchiostoma lanceolatum TaxID=7740 RepID=A0A8J9ZRM1_BRALA|nr:LRP6 [Branchiostoma lanceolatum]
MMQTHRGIALLLCGLVAIQMICQQEATEESEDSNTNSPDEAAAASSGGASDGADPDIIVATAGGTKPAALEKGDVDSLQLGKPVDGGASKTGNKAVPAGHKLILVADSTDRTITRLTTDDDIDYQSARYTISNGAHRPIAVDYDPTEDLIYWTSSNGANSLVARFPYESGTVVRLDGQQASVPDGIAVDVISRNLYWTDTGIDRITVSRLDGSFRKSLITQGLDEPRAIVVDPNSGWMYWTDWGNQSKIERARMDGTQRSVIVYIGEGRGPNGLALDAAANRIYWCHGATGEIWTSGVTGSNPSPTRVYTHTNAHLFGIAVDETYLYWAAWNGPGIHRISKSLQGYFKISRPQFKNLNGIRVMTTSNTSSQPNACSASNGNCAQLCLPVPGGGRTCACQDEWNLASDGRSCFSDDERTRCHGSCPWSNVTEASCVDGFCECSSKNYQRYTCLPVVGSCAVQRNSPTAQAEAVQVSIFEPGPTFSCVTDDNSQYDVHVLAVYEGIRSRWWGSQQNNTEAPEVDVHVIAGQVSKPVVLVLSSYEAVNWMLHLPDSEDVEVHKVLLVAYHIDQSNLTVRSGSVNTVQRLPGRTEGVPACAYGKDDDGCNTVDLLKYVERDFGPVSSFTGTYRAGRWNLRIGLAIQCPTLTAPTNGILYPPGATSYQDKVLFFCNTDYVRNGALETTCQYNGMWSSPAPTCTRRQCQTLIALANGALSPVGANSYQDRVTFSCNPGYRLKGASSVTCQADGTWSRSVPICTGTCPTLTAPVNGALIPARASSANDVVRITCNNGYVRNGALYTMCQADGTWSNAVPTCTPESSSHSGASTGTGIGAVVGVLAGLILIVGVICYCNRRQARTPSTDRSPNPTDIPLEPTGQEGLYPDGVPPFLTGAPPYPDGAPPYPTGAPPYPTGAPPYPGGAPPYPTGAHPYPIGPPPYPTVAPPYPAGAPPYPASAPPYPTGAPPCPPSAPPYPIGGVPSFSTAPDTPGQNYTYPTAIVNPAGPPSAFQNQGVANPGFEPPPYPYPPPGLASPPAATTGQSNQQEAVEMSAMDTSK